MLIRAEKECDRDAVRAVNLSAFESPAEADLVDALRQEAHPIVSLVAVEDAEIAGHVMFSPAIVAGRPDLQVMGLGPMAVVPGYQRKGIGSALVRAGVDQCRRLGFDAVIVLGHPHFYPRFGFVPAVRFGIHSGYEVPDEAFMVLELHPDALSGISGKVRYHSAFGDV